MAYHLSHLTEQDTRQLDFSQRIGSKYSNLVQNTQKCDDPFTHKSNDRSHVQFVPQKEGPSCITCPSAPSPFTCLALARFSVLKNNTLLDLLSNLNKLNLPEKQGDESNTSPPSKLVTLGLNGLISVLQQLKERDPTVCVSALDALLNLLQSLYPEELSKESASFIDKLFQLLHSMTESSANEIMTRAMSCLVALSVGRGQSDYILKAAFILLSSSTNDSSCSTSQISIPLNYQSLYTHLLALASSGRSDGWMCDSVQLNRVFTIQMADEDAKTHQQDDDSLITSDGSFIYVLTTNQLSKIGTGFGDSIRGLVYRSTLQFGASQYEWMSTCNGSLYLRRKQTSRLVVLDGDTLAEIGEVLLPSSSEPTAVLCADGSSFYSMTLDSTGMLTVTPFDDNFTLTGTVTSPDGSEIKAQLTMDQISFLGKGPLPSIKADLVEAIRQIHHGSELLLVLTVDGKVYYNGKGSAIGMQDTTGTTWQQLCCFGTEQIVHISSNLESGCVLFRSSIGHLWCAGNSYGSESLPPAIFAASARNRKKSEGDKPKRVIAANHKKIIDSAVSASTTAVVTENGKVYLFGRHATHCHQETGQVIGLEHVHMQQICVGKSHVVAVSRHGHVYTWGLNNLYQCGRAEGLSGTPSETSAHSSPRHADTEEESTPSIQMCSPAEHIWVKDVTTVCTLCGRCSGHGNRCNQSRVDTPISSCGPGESGCIRCGLCRRCGESDVEVRSDRETTASESSGGGRRMLLNPGRLTLKVGSTEPKISQAVCGNYHTLMLTTDKMVLSFGSNCHGQLGVGDCKRRPGPQLVQLPTDVTPVELAAGANHSLIRCSDGTVFSFGSNREGQLGRDGEGKLGQSEPGLVQGIGSKFGCSAVWIGGSNDVTMIKVHTTLLSQDDLAKTHISMNPQYLMIFRRNGGSIVAVQRKSGVFTQFNPNSTTTSRVHDSWCIDPKYDVLWHLDSTHGNIFAYSHWRLSKSASTTNISTLSESRVSSKLSEKDSLDFMCDPEFWISSGGIEGATASLTQLGLNMIAMSFGIVTSHTKVATEMRGRQDGAVIERPEDSSYHFVNRFQNYGGGWGYSAQSVEAIQFQPSQDINVIGLGLFAGRGEYLARIKILRLVDQDFDEQNVELVVESEEILFESPPREKAHIFVGRPALCRAGQWFIAWAQINGPSSDCGAGGVATACGDDGVVFNFRSSRLSNNGTDMHVGQLPMILYSTNDQTHGRTPLQGCTTSMVSPLKLTKLLYPTVNTFEAVILLLRWCTDYCFPSSMSPIKPDVTSPESSSSTSSIVDFDSAFLSWKQERGVCIGIMVLRLLTHYCRQVYPKAMHSGDEKTEYSPSMVPLRRTLWDMLKLGHSLSIGDPRTLLMNELVECCKSCLHVLLPTVGLLQEDFSQKINAPTRSDWSLIALIEFLCDEQKPILLLSHTSQTPGPSGCNKYPQLISDALKSRRPPSPNISIPIKFTTLMAFCLELVFAPPTPEDGSMSQSRLRDASSRLVSVMASELVHTATSIDESPILSIPSRFGRLSSSPVWDMSSGTADAISFRVSCSGYCLHGIGCYTGGAGDYAYNMEVLVNQSDGMQETWQVLEKCSGSALVVGAHDNGISIIRLNKPVKLQPVHMYAVRLYIQGSKTWCGENGTCTIQGVYPVTFTFYPCSLSLNGTSTTRGQIPTLIYSESESTSKPPIDTTEYCNWFLLLLRNLSNKLMACLNMGLVPCDTDLFSQVYGWTSVLLQNKPQLAVSIFGAVDELVPIIAAANANRKDTETNNSEQILLENDHPYKSGRIYSQKATFDKSVQFLCLEFSPQCSLGHADDNVSVYTLESKRDTIALVGKYNQSSGFPIDVILVPGNTVWFVLDTCSSGSAGNRPSVEQLYGVQCLITAHSCPVVDPLALMELELSWVCAAACRHLITMPVTGLSIRETDQYSANLIRKHGSLLRKGLNLAHLPTIHETLQGKLPPRHLSSELKFLSDMIQANNWTVGGQLSRWFSPQPFIDIHNCELALRSPEVRVGQPCLIELILKDQHGNTATAKDLDIEVSVRLGNVETVSTEPLQKEPYQHTYLNKARYIAITMMNICQQYSFEEMRLVYFRDSVLKESIPMKITETMSYQGQWTAKQSAKYTISCRVDKFMLPQTYTVEVKNGTRLAIVKSGKAGKISDRRTAMVPPNAWTEGVRVRCSPALSATQVGLISRGSTITYCEEIENKDGVWVQLNEESVVLHCPNLQPPARAYCLQYSAMLSKTIMLTHAHNQHSIDEFNDSTSHSMVVTCDEIYVAVKNTKTIKIDVRSAPSTSVEPEAQLTNSDTLHSIGWLHNKEGVWIRLQEVSCQSLGSPRKRILVQDGFCMVQDAQGTAYLQKVHNSSQIVSQSSAIDQNGVPKKIEKRKPMAQVHPQQSSSGRVVESTSPALIDSIRTVYAAVLWQENLVHDAMACSAYLKFHPELYVTSHANVGHIPASMQLLLSLWKETGQCIRASIDRQLGNVEPASAEIPEPFQNNGLQCELCEAECSVPLANHMRNDHPGCGSHSGGHGYNSLGRYTSGWTGNCGDGGRGAATWYLLCGSCRRQHMHVPPSGRRDGGHRRSRGINQAVGTTVPPHVVIKRNANFLLELESCDSRDNLDVDSVTSSAAPSRRTSTWTINLFPHTTTPPFLANKGVDTTANRQTSDSQNSATIRQGSPFTMTTHTSDPGPKRPLAAAFQCSIPSSEPFHSCRPNMGSRDVIESQMLLASPSAALKTTQGDIQRPVISFVTEEHDLKKIRDVMKLAVMRSVALAHAFKAWNWLLRILSNENCVMNVVWNYICAMSDEESHTSLLYHPCRMTLLAGTSSRNMLHHFHTFLKTIAVIIRSGCVEPLLRRMCFRAWMFELTPHEQDLIRSCQLLSQVGQLLSEQENPIINRSTDNRNVTLTNYEDIMEAVLVEASSRPEMCHGLLDANTDTFWESAEGDRNKSRVIKVSVDENKANPVILAIFIDNVQDENFRTSLLVISGVVKDRTRQILLCQNVDANYVGWIKCSLIDQGHQFKIEVRGPDVSVRVRCVSILGTCTHARHRAMRPSVSNLQPMTGAQLDAFTLLQAIASQAFNDVLDQDNNGALREQVLDILFSREQLQPLQSYVCAQLMAALEREVECLKGSKRNFSYCCGLLALLARICSGTSAKALLGSRHSVLVSISELVLFSSSIVQCQIIDTIEKLMPLVDPQTADVTSLTVNLLVVIAKSVNLMIRSKSSRNTCSGSVQTCASAETLALWRLDKPGSLEIAQLTRNLLASITSGKFGPAWAAVMQLQLSNHILTLAKSTADQTGQESAEEFSRKWLKMRVFWLAAAALTCIKDGNWLKSSPLWQSDSASTSCSTIVMCENHDDGRTMAHVFCESCQMALCRECFSILHLSKRFRCHVVNLLASASKGGTAAEVDVHDGSTRLRLRGLLLLLDASTLNGMVEFHSTADSFSEMIRRQGASPSSPSGSSFCRFCGTPTSQGRNVCSDEECMQYKTVACTKVCEKGHLCCGIVNEMNCPPCLKCGYDETGSKLRQDADDLCVICFTDRLGAAPSIQLLSCGHIFHQHCCLTTISKRWPGPRISFNFMKCPLCQRNIGHPSLQAELLPVQTLYDQVAMKAKIRLQYDGLNECSAVNSPQSQFHQDPVGYALERYVYVLCHLCGKAYFGGESHCEAALASSQYKSEELVCGACSDVSKAQMCPRHGAEYLEYKCRFCCSVAVFFCFGTTHFCAICHDDFQRLISIPKTQLPQCPVAPKGVQLEAATVPCPLKIEHPPTGEEFALGCGICRNISSF